MANYTWTISHSANLGGTYTDITGKVQSWNYRYGRGTVTDQWATGMGQMQGWDVANLPAINVGDWIKFADSTHGTQYILAVADYIRVYNPVATADTWEMVLEDQYAVAGRARAEYAATASAGTAIGTVIATGGFVAGISVSAYGGNNTTCSAITVAKGDSITGFFNPLNNQGGAYIHAENMSSNIDWFGVDATAWWGDPYNKFTNTNFDDDGTLTNGEPYSEIHFEGLADAYFDKVYVAPAGLAIQDAGTGVRTYQINTYHETTGQADSWADYLLIQLGSTSPTPGTLVTTTASWSTVANLNPINLLPGNEITLRLRGTTYYAIIEGGVISATPDQTRFTLYLSDREAVNYLILNDPVWGKLDSNRLGF